MCSQQAEHRKAPASAHSEALICSAHDEANQLDWSDLGMMGSVEGAADNAVLAAAQVATVTDVSAGRNWEAAIVESAGVVVAAWVLAEGAELQAFLCCVSPFHE